MWSGCIAPFHSDPTLKPRAASRRRPLPSSAHKAKRYSTQYWTRLAQTIVIAEDLGVIPPFVRASLGSLGVPGYKVMRWEKIDEGAPGRGVHFARGLSRAFACHDRDA